MWCVLCFAFVIAILFLLLTTFFPLALCHVLYGTWAFSEEFFPWFKPMKIELFNYLTSIKTAYYLSQKFHKKNIMSMRILIIFDMAEYYHPFFLLLDKLSLLLLISISCRLGHSNLCTTFQLHKHLFCCLRFFIHSFAPFKIYGYFLFILLNANGQWPDQIIMIIMRYICTQI